MGKIYLITGKGAGKTTSALGLAMRSIGHGHRVVVIQFLKFWKNTGEYKIQSKLKGFYKVYQFGRPVWLKLDGQKAEFGKKKFHLEAVKKLDREYALRGLGKAEEIMLHHKPDLLILDEACLAVHSGILKEKEVLGLMKKVPAKTTLVLTGRGATKGMIKRADFVNTISPTKYPKSAKAEKGIQF
jgi:cob(I)alamin adenosyltransferase